MEMDGNGAILKILNREQMDERVNALVTERLRIGAERYGHGVCIEDGTTQYGTVEDSWAEMALEEVIDGLIYVAAQLEREAKDNLPDGMQELKLEFVLGALKHTAYMLVSYMETDIRAK